MDWFIDKFNNIVSCIKEMEIFPELEPQLEPLDINMINSTYKIHKDFECVMNDIELHNRVSYITLKEYMDTINQQHKDNMKSVNSSVILRFPKTFNREFS